MKTRIQEMAETITQPQSESDYRTLVLRFEAVTRVIEILADDLSIEDKVCNMGQVLGELLPFDRFTLGLPDLNCWYRFVVADMRVEKVDGSSPLDESSTGCKWVMTHRKSLLRHCIPKELRYVYDAILLNAGMNSDLIVPLISGDQVIGTFDFASRQVGAFSETDLATVESVARAVASVVKGLVIRQVMDRELVRLERLDAMGELVQGVAHNFNNILVGVLGNAQLIEMRSKDPDILEDAGHIVESAYRARDLVQQLNLSILGESEVPCAVNVAEAVQAAVDLTQSRWQEMAEANGIDIQVVMRLEDGGVFVHATFVGLRDILMHLLRNAVDAMPQGGQIVIETAQVREGVQIVFSDTGVGMYEEVLRRAFEPFFTTKVDVGSGLGLSAVYGMVRGWQGTVDVTSVLGKGTTFRMWLPQYKDA